MRKGALVEQQVSQMNKKKQNQMKNEGKTQLVVQKMEFMLYFWILLFNVLQDLSLRSMR